MQAQRPPILHGVKREGRGPVFGAGSDRSGLGWERPLRRNVTYRYASVRKIQVWEATSLNLTCSKRTPIAALSLRDQVEQIVELRKADRGRFGAFDQRLSLGPQRGHAEG